MADVMITIEKLAFGGSGIGRLDGKVCFVPFSCPGDELSVRVKEEKRSYLTASIVDVVSPSPHRVTPACPLFGRCGGCDWQHIDYACQIGAKRQILAETLWRGARVTDERVASTVASPQQFGYRSRVQFKLFGFSEGLQIGFFRAGSHYVEDAPLGCPIALPIINQALQRLRDVLYSFPEPAKIPQINIDCGEQGAVAIIHYSGSDPESVVSFFRERLAELAPLTGLFLRAGSKSILRKICGDGTLNYSLPGIGSGADCLIGFRPGGFSQVNLTQNRAVLELISRLAGFGGIESVLDLYCGNGNFSLPVACGVRAVTGIEEYADSIAAAVDNASCNGIGNAEFLCSDATGGVKRLADQGRAFDVVILDPPRAGAVEALPEICRLKPSKIIYVSCDPNTLARDCGRLALAGYRLQACIPVDMFPQTYHLESVTLLEQAA